MEISQYLMPTTANSRGNSVASLTEEEKSRQNNPAGMSTGWLREEEARATAAVGSGSTTRTACCNLKKEEKKKKAAAAAAARPSDRSLSRSQTALKEREGGGKIIINGRKIGSETMSGLCVEKDVDKNHLFKQT